MGVPLDVPGILFKKGKVIKKFPQEQLVDVLLKEIEQTIFTTEHTETTEK
ncbi:MAG: hypothetical protein SRB1_00241 [Desulfobacteraceae bacterium Eth-SRB1]|nr:MAG: hypothetical protein SRB1_00241 [Desulfobacteraceae bacterium Eth-SRB1]